MKLFAGSGRPPLPAFFCAAAALAALLAAQPGDAADRRKVKHGLYEDELISAAEAARKHAQAGVLFLDARDKRSYDRKHIAGARLPYSAEYYRRQELFRAGVIPRMDATEDDALVEGMRQAGRDTEIITYCGRECGASAALLFRLKRLGFERTRVLDGGIDAWEDAGHPVAEAPA